MGYYVASGTTVDADGFLVEEFWAGGLGMMLVFASLVGYALWGLLKLVTLLRSR
jgi:hypothetical protein